jgi:hypothetical protein
LKILSGKDVNIADNSVNIVFPYLRIEEATGLFVASLLQCKAQFNHLQKNTRRYKPAILIMIESIMRDRGAAMRLR